MSAQYGWAASSALEYEVVQAVVTHAAVRLLIRGKTSDATPGTLDRKEKTKSKAETNKTANDAIVAQHDPPVVT